MRERPVYDPSVRPFAGRKPECYGCGHDPHPAGECTARPLFLRRRDRTCECTIGGAHVDPDASPNWRAPIVASDKTCLVSNCWHAQRDHKEWEDGAMCRKCFDLNPSDDSHIEEGGVYHRFRS